MKKPLGLLLSLLCSGIMPAAAAAASLESQAYEAGRWAEPQLRLDELEERALASTQKIELELTHRRAPDLRELTRRQKRALLLFMAAGGLIGGLAGGVFGFVVGFFAGPIVWYLLEWAELMPPERRPQRSSAAPA